MNIKNTRHVLRIQYIKRKNVVIKRMNMKKLLKGMGREELHILLLHDHTSCKLFSNV
jgi:hypothetical protein